MLGQRATCCFIETDVIIWWHVAARSGKFPSPPPCLFRRSHDSAAFPHLHIGGPKGAAESNKTQMASAVNFDEKAAELAFRLPALLIPPKIREGGLIFFFFLFAWNRTLISTNSPAAHEEWIRCCGMHICVALLHFVGVFFLVACIWSEAWNWKINLFRHKNIFDDHLLWQEVEKLQSRCNLEMKANAI